MKKQLLKWILLLFFGYHTASAQSPSYIYIEMPGLNGSRGGAELKAALSTMTEITDVQFCEKMHLAIVTVTGDKSTIISSISNRFKEENYRFIIKKELPLQQVLNQCK